MKFAMWDKVMPRRGVSHVDLYRQHLAEVQLAEQCGFEHLWFFEHHVSPVSPIPSPNLMISAAAVLTSRIRLGNMVNVLPYRNPLILAEEIAMLDVISNGRLDVGIGRGLKPTEFDAFCLSQALSREMFEESIAIMLRVWADENFAVNGKFFAVDKQTPLSPGVVQKPHPPLWVSAQSRESLQWAAERDLMFGQIDAMIEDCARDCEFYRSIQVAHGHSAAPRLFLTRELYVAETDQQARDEAYEYLLADWDLWSRYAQFARNGRLPDSYDVWRKRAPVLHALSYDEMIERGLVLVGSPDSIVEKIKLHQERLDLAVLACVTQLAHLPHEKVTRSMRLFGEEVIPRLKASDATSDRAHGISANRTQAERYPAEH